MENKEMKITPPDGWEIDLEKSDLTKNTIVYKKVEKKETYQSICDELFKDGKAWYINIGTKNYTDLCRTKGHLLSLQALNKLCNVAYYLNEGWLPDWKDGIQKKWFITNLTGTGNVIIDYGFTRNDAQVYFKSIDLAQRAISILGEETIRLALTRNF